MKKLVILFVVLFASVSFYGQRHAIGPYFGTSYYLGDLMPTRHFGIPSLNYGAIYRYNAPNNRISVRLAAHHGKVVGKSEFNRKNLRYKNLDFFSPLTNFDMGIEINFLKYDTESDRNNFTPYIFGGLSVFKFNPQVEFQGRVYELQPLGTEGQGLTAYPDRKPYKLMSWSIPFGGGIKFQLGKIVSLGLDWTVHKTFTDYLDDVSSSYPDPALLAAEESPLAAMLSIRQFEDEAALMGLNIQVDGNGMPVNQQDYLAYMELLSTRTDGQRGNQNDMDWYGVAGLTLTFKIVGPRKETCPAYKQHFRYKEYKLF